MAINLFKLNVILSTIPTANGSLCLVNNDPGSDNLQQNEKSLHYINISFWVFLGTTQKSKNEILKKRNLPCLNENSMKTNASVQEAITSVNEEKKREQCIDYVVNE